MRKLLLAAAGSLLLLMAPLSSPLQGGGPPPVTATVTATPTEQSTAFAAVENYVQVVAEPSAAPLATAVGSAPRPVATHQRRARRVTALQQAIKFKQPPCSRRPFAGTYQRC